MSLNALPFLFGNVQCEAAYSVANVIYHAGRRVEWGIGCDAQPEEKVSILWPHTRTGLPLDGEGFWMASRKRLNAAQPVPGVKLSAASSATVITAAPVKLPSRRSFKASFAR